MEEERISTEQSADQIRKTYTKPVLSIVRLAAEEAVLANCKNNGGVGARDFCRANGDQSCSSIARS